MFFKNKKKSINLTEQEEELLNSIDEEEKNYISYDYDFDKKLTNKKEDKSWWDKVWGDYKKTGEWKGYSYYQESTLDYRYIEQMANLLSQQYNVEVRPSNSWSVDIKNKILFYDPTSLMFGTKANLIANLLHEMGHIIHTDEAADQSPYVKKYKQQAFFTINTFEDTRIDRIMSKSYGSSEEIFKANIPAAERIASSYDKQSRSLLQYVEQALIDLIRKYPGRILENVPEGKNSLEASESEKLRLSELMKDIMTKGTIFDYCAKVICESYGISKQHKIDNIEKLYDKTKKFVEETSIVKNTKAVVDIADKNIFPIIEELFVIVPEKDIKPDARGAVKESIKNLIDQLIHQVAQGDIEGEAQSKKYANPIKNKIRAAGMGGGIPKEWYEGNYDSLKASVMSAINELTRKLNFLRKEEQVLKYEQDKKRGKLNTKKIYRVASDNYRVFKKKEEIKDTIKSFTFSLVIDRSGSMGSDGRIVHTTRGLIILAEVFKKLSIPFEVIYFGDNAVVFKNFDEDYSKDIKKHISGVIQHCSEETWFRPVFGKTKIESRPEHNKIMVVLSDGDIGDNDGGSSARAKIDEFAKKNIKVIGFGIDCGDHIKNVCRDENSRAINSAGELPEAFVKLLKNLLKIK